jgi:hypothetical protein
MTLSHNCGVFIGIARDRSSASNRITLDPSTQQPRIQYRVTPADALVLLQGRSAVMRCMAGASPAALLPIHTGAPWYYFDSSSSSAAATTATSTTATAGAVAAAVAAVDDSSGNNKSGSGTGCTGGGSKASAKQSSDAKFEQYLDGIAALGVAPNTATVFSAHQMGSCRYTHTHTATTTLIF